MTYSESNLVFQFPEHWAVRKYDGHRFYRRISGLGLKGVDFLLIDPTDGGHLYLLEVKNFRTRTHEGGVFVAKLKPATELVETVTTKYEHTLHALRIVHLYYRRKWWYRWLLPLLKASTYLQFDAVFWTHAHRLSVQEQQHTLVLWLETEEEQEDYAHAVKQAWQQGTSINVKYQLASSMQPFPEGMGLV